MGMTSTWVAKKPSKKGQCPYCAGRGRGRQGPGSTPSKVPSHQRAGMGFDVRVCPVCFGSGQLREY